MLPIPSSSPPRSRQGGERWFWLLIRRILLPFSIAGFAGLTLGLKVAHYARVQFDLAKDNEAVVATFLEEHGWSRVGVLNLAVNGEPHATRYIAPGCPGEIRVALLSSIGQEAELMRNMVNNGERLLFVGQGVISEMPPRNGPVWQTLSRITRNLHLSFLRQSPYLAISTPAECHTETDVPWSAL